METFHCTIGGKRYLRTKTEKATSFFVLRKDGSNSVLYHGKNAKICAKIERAFLAANTKREAAFSVVARDPNFSISA